MTDTSSEARRIQASVLRGADGRQRLRQALELSDTVRALALTRLTRDHPDLPARTLALRLLRDLDPGCDLPPDRP